MCFHLIWEGIETPDQSKDASSNPCKEWFDLIWRITKLTQWPTDPKWTANWLSCKKCKTFIKYVFSYFSIFSRYKSPSPATQDLSGKPGLRRRVQSPNRRDYKDFSAREFRSPHRTTSRLTDEEEDSGADSMNDFISNHSCRSGC